MINKFAVVVTVLLALLLAILVWAAFHYSGKAAAASANLDNVTAQANSQTAIIAQQAFVFQQSNNIAQAAGLYEVKLIGDTQEKEIEYRTVLQKEPTCNLFIPASIANGLYDYADRLRASAMSTDTGGATQAPAGAVTARSMTYCQAVLWILPLLAVIDQGNNQLTSIRQIEALK